MEHNPHSLNKQVQVKTVKKTHTHTHSVYIIYYYQRLVNRAMKQRHTNRCKSSLTSADGSYAILKHHMLVQRSLLPAVHKNHMGLFSFRIHSSTSKQDTNTHRAAQFSNNLMRIQSEIKRSWRQKCTK